jgi:uncharacterized protein (TIGR00297 family)
MSPWIHLVLGVGLGVVMAVGGYWRRSLSRSGAIAAAIVGAVTFSGGGWAWGILLVAFFVASSALSLYNPKRKAKVAAEKFDKGSRRDWAQVVANGGWGTLLALLAWFQPQGWLFFAFVGTMATVTADTWATELGTLSPTSPRLVTNGKVVPPGTNGAVSLMGTVAALAGGLFIGTIAFVLAQIGGVGELTIAPFWLPMIGGISGLAGAFADSLLGATVQKVYYCPTCDTETEKALHSCGTVTQPLRGWSWLDNDMVNFLSSVVGSLVAAWLALILMA